MVKEVNILAGIASGITRNACWNLCLGKDMSKVKEECSTISVLFSWSSGKEGGEAEAGHLLCS